MAADAAPVPTPRRRPLYEGSTQYKNWRFSAEKLAHIRATMNAAAVDAIRKTFEENSPGSSSGVEFLTAEEELLLVKLYIGKIGSLCGHFHFPEEVEATAASYLKRFYLKNTVMDWHPKNIMLTALFLATKTTNNPITLDAYTSQIPRTSPSDVLDLEFLVAQSLGFEFAVWHAHRALWGLWLDLQSLPNYSTFELKQEVYENGLGHARAARLTDTELIYTPSQIALACLSLCAPQAANAWADSKLGTDLAARETLRTTVDEVQTLIARDGHAPNVERVRVVDRRLKLCKNPEKVVGSNVYMAKKAEEDRKAAEKRVRKAEEAQRAMEENDPFGEVIAWKKPVPAADDDDDDE